MHYVTKISDCQVLLIQVFFAVTQTTYCPRFFLLQNLNFLQVAFSFLIPLDIKLKPLILLLKLFKMFFVVSKRNLKRSLKVNNITK